MDKFNFIGTDVDILAFDEFFAKCHSWLQDKSARSRHVACVNVNCAVESYKDPKIRDVFSKADVRGADSMPFVYWIRMMTKKRCDRLYAPDIVMELGPIAVRNNYRLYLYGGAEGVPEKLKAFLEEKFPGIQIVGHYSPPFRKLTAEEDAEVCEAINQTRPDFVIVGLGSPKQDMWIQEHLHSIPGTIMIAAGATFDFFSDRIKQAPVFVQKSGFEWAYRLTQDPKRLWKRYTTYNAVFIWNFGLQCFRLRRFGNMRDPAQEQRLLPASARV